jgi:hypothetical protein
VLVWVGVAVSTGVGVSVGENAVVAVGGSVTDCTGSDMGVRAGELHPTNAKKPIAPHTKIFCPGAGKPAFPRTHIGNGLISLRMRIFIQSMSFFVLQGAEIRGGRNVPGRHRFHPSRIGDPRIASFLSFPRATVTAHQRIDIPSTPCGRPLNRSQEWRYTSYPGAAGSSGRFDPRIEAAR